MYIIVRLKNPWTPEILESLVQMKKGPWGVNKH